MPTQFGPMIRSRCGFAASSIGCCNAAPTGGASSAKPAEITTAALVPRRPSWSINAGTVGGGLAITARSGAIGSSAIDRNATRPRIDVAVRIDRQDRSVETAVEEIFEQLATDRRRALGRADQCDRARLQGEVEIADRHTTTLTRTD